MGRTRGVDVTCVASSIPLIPHIGRKPNLFIQRSRFWKKKGTRQTFRYFERPKASSPPQDL